MHLVMSMSYRVVRRLPSALSSASIVIALETNKQNDRKLVELKLSNKVKKSCSSTDLSRANSLAEFACNASFLARRIASQSMLASESRTQRAFLKRIVDGHWFGEELSQRSQESLDELAQEHLVHDVVGQVRVEFLVGQRDIL